VGMWTCLGTGLEAINVTLWKRTCPHFVHTHRLWKAEFNGDGLVNLVKRISRQFSMQTWSG
jgi:hypothetical protein